MDDFTNGALERPKHQNKANSQVFSNTKNLSGNQQQKKGVHNGRGAGQEPLMVNTSQDETANSQKVLPAGQS